MSSKMDRRTLIAAARRILGRAESDERAVPAMFLTHLKAWLERHPNEDKFELSLDEGEGYITCGVCGAFVDAGDGEPDLGDVDVFGSFENLENHIATPQHTVKKRASTSTTDARTRESYPGPHIPRKEHDYNAHRSNSRSSMHSPSTNTTRTTDAAVTVPQSELTKAPKAQPPSASNYKSTLAGHKFFSPSMSTSALPNTPESRPPPSSRTPQIEVVDLTLDDSDDDNIVPIAISKPVLRVKNELSENSLEGLRSTNQSHSELRVPSRSDSDADTNSESRFSSPPASTSVSRSTSTPISRASSSRSASNRRGPPEGVEVINVDADFELAKQYQAALDAGIDNMDPFVFNNYPTYNNDNGSNAAASSSNDVYMDDYGYSGVTGPNVQSGQVDFYTQELYIDQLRGDIRDAREYDNMLFLPSTSTDIALRCNLCHYSVTLPIAADMPLRLHEVEQGLRLYKEHLNSLHHERRLNAFNYREPQTNTTVSSPESSPTHLTPYLPTSSAQISSYQNGVCDNALGKRKFPGGWTDEEEYGFDGFSRDGYPMAGSSSLAGALDNYNANGFMNTPQSLQNRHLQNQQMQQQQMMQLQQMGLGARNPHIMGSASGANNPNAYAPQSQRLDPNYGVDRVDEDQEGITYTARDGLQRSLDVASFMGPGSREVLGGFTVAKATRPEQTEAMYGREYGTGPSSGSGYGPQVNEQQRSFQEFMLKAVDDFKDVTSVAEAREELGIGAGDTNDDKIPGMSVQLLAHQVIGVNWMVKQEIDDEKKGGILADAMGLGKTIQMISTIVKMQPTMPRPVVRYDLFDKRYKADDGRGKAATTVAQANGDDEVRRTTLVLAPASLLQQWYEEVMEKTEPGTLKAHIHHGKDKLKSVTELRKYDVIITSYQTLTMDIPTGKKRKKKNGENEPESNDDEADSDADTSERRLGVLGKMKWLRVAIDEAQNIRNKGTRISQAVAKLDAEYRWCLTGTPVTNSLADLYGFLRFCSFSPWDEWKTFNDQIAKIQKRNPTRAGQKAQTILKRHLLRRTKDSTIDGKPILQLGPKNVDIVELEFTPDERIIYEHIESKHQRIVSKFLKEGTVMKNYTFILVMILRLRQMCGHPNLILEKASEGEGSTDDVLSREKELDRAKRTMGEKEFDGLLRRFRERVENRIKAEQEGEEAEDDECAICYEPPAEKRRVTLCGHEFCSDCILELLRNHEAVEGEDKAQCPMCRKPLDKKDIFFGSVFEPSEDEVDKIYADITGDNPPSKRMKYSPESDELDAKDGRLGSSHKGKGKAIANPEQTEARLAEEEVAEMMKSSKFEPSTKMAHMMQLILQWRKEAPEDKVIIYSQWTSMLNLVQEHLGDNLVTSLRYDGKMNRMERVNAIQEFKKPEGPRVMLISLKCGGVGLNLTVANRVINLDLAWNFATEAQAYDRVHRLGQHKPVTVQRIIIKNTIEERIMKLQDQKQVLSDAALGEGKVGKIKRMSAREIAQLFDLRI